MRRTLRTLLVIAMLATPLSARATGPVRIAELRSAADTRALGEHLRAQLAGSPAGFVRAAADALGHPVALDPIDPRPLPGTPSPVAAPVALLSGAVAQAEAVVERATATLTDRERARLLRSPLRAAPAPITAVERDPNRATLRAAADHRVPAPGRRWVSAAERVDRDALLSGLLALLDASERALPWLRAPVVAGVVSTCGVTGDVVYESGDCSIIIAGDGANAYPPELNPTLLIDLGGDDTYPGEKAAGAGVVALLIDVAGDDTYTHELTADDGSNVFVATQGYGSLGIGVLIDAGGDDTYTVRGSATAPPGALGGTATAAGQGGGLAGAGALVDLGGHDDRSVEATSAGGDVFAIGQGAGQSGVGVALDVDPGGPGGPGGDADRVHARSTLHPIEVTETFSRYSIGDALAVGQGAGRAIGIGIGADDIGVDLHSVIAEGGAAEVQSQGSAVIGAGLFVDGGSPDHLVGRALGRAELSLTTTEPSVCWTAETIVTASDSLATGQGGAIAGGVAAFVGSSQDSLELVARSAAIAETTITSAVSCPNSATSTATAGDGIATGLGAGDLGIGAFAELDTSSSSRLLDASSTAHAATDVSAPGDVTESATATPGTGLARGMGFGASFGVGITSDTGGDDVYTATTLITAIEVETGLGSGFATPGVELVFAWAEPDAIAVLADLGGTDTYSTTAPNPAANDADWTNGTGTSVGFDRALLPG